MKKSIIFILTIVLTSFNAAFAIQDVQEYQEPKVISDREKQQELLNSFSEVNQYTDNLFTQKTTVQKQREKEMANELLGKEIIEKDPVHEYHPRTITPVKKLRLYLKNGRQKTVQVEEVEQTGSEQIVTDCDEMEYFADRTELEATGHVAMRFPQNNAVLTCDKLIYNQTTNKITAVGHVVLTKESMKMEGDYLVVNMNEENVVLDNPETQFGQVHFRSKLGYMYGDKLIQEQGSMFITKKTMIKMRSEMYGPDLERMYVPDNEKSALFKESAGSKLKIKTTDLILNSKKDHDTVTLKKADIYFNDKKIGFIPAITVHTNKNRDYVETDIPEIGTLTDLGMYAGPGFVFDTPMGSTLKLLPMVNYQGGNDESTVGFGGIAKFKSATNRTEIAYGTANKVFLMKGIQYLDDHLNFQYSANRFIDDWFMGYRKPRLGGELVYQNSVMHRNFLAKDMDMMFTHRLAGGYFQDGLDNAVPLGTDGVGTFRGKYMAEINQTLFKINDEATNPVNLRFSVIGQGAATVYGTGGTQFIGRIGPQLHTQYHRWMQDIGYFASAYDDKTPLINFDRYMYGKSNAYARESLRICKYLTASWLVSLNLSQDSWNEKLLQENAFFVAIGPDDLRLNIGYDVIRQQSFVTMSMNLDAKGMKMDYDRMIVKNPDTIGENSGKDEDTTLFERDKTELVSDEPVIERAEVTDIVEDERL
ncbi:MAG: hypothetical protein DKM22_05225 [Candidatus Melainabacteria bacterium]|nr:MAG: hypothetical protein DKM22_05225 [Candidatus Melainabacteria bacterium]